jgi:NADPH:quinone reductase-like Zn-dependent oxidoreductase
MSTQIQSDPRTQKTLETPSHALPAVMEAITQDRYGTGETLQLKTVDLPEIGPDDCLVEVHAAGLDRGVWHLMAGLPLVIRLGFGFRGPKSGTPGMDVAGRVVAMGANVTDFNLGDEVYGICSGSFAQFACVKARKLSPKPSCLSFVEAAAVPVSGITALQGLRDKLQVQSGQRILITGASGGVGSYAVQMAKAMGAHVTAECSGPKAEFVRSLGADQVIDYQCQDLVTMPHEFDGILDLAGNRPLKRLRRILASTGTLVIAGGEEGGRWFGGVDRQLRGMLMSPFLGQNIRTYIAEESGAQLGEVSRLIVSGSVVPPIDKVFPLDEVPGAMEYLVAGRVRGKVVIGVRPEAC